MVLEIKGDIRETPIHTIAHGVNCQGVMGSGVARALFERWPEIRSEYLKYHKEYRKDYGFTADSFLGTNHYVYPQFKSDSIEGDEKQIINMHTQLNFGPGDKLYVDYAAIMNCFEEVAISTPAIAVPKIGAGLAGGNWDTIRQIMINKTQKKGIDLVIYHLEDNDGICPIAY